MNLSRPATSAQLSLALTILRVVTGVVFLAHGAQKLFVWGFDGVGAGFAQMGIPLAGIVGPAVALVEFFGGMALVAGLLTRLAAGGLAIVMLGALLIAHLSGGFFLPSGFEFVFTLLGSAVTLALTGAGPWSLDGHLAARNEFAGTEVRSMRRAA
jgi:putative oxidoreductase